MGGFFESMVKSCKSVLRKIIQKMRFNYVEMVTVLKELENVINNRPLVYVYYGNLLEPLTPNKLIYGKNINVNVCDIQSTCIGNLGKQAARLESIIESFWGYMEDVDYLSNLREAHQKRNKRAKNSINPNVDDIVLIHDEKLKRSDWRMGRVNKMIISKDGNCRAAEVVIISNGKQLKLLRPVNKLYPIESSVSSALDNHSYSVNHNKYSLDSMENIKRNKKPEK